MREKRLLRPKHESYAQETRKEKLAHFVLDNIGLPIDKLALAAILETYGISDEDSASTYGKKDVFDLADEIYHRCRLITMSLT